MSKFGLVFKNTSYQIIGKLVTSSVGIVSTALLTRYLGPQVFGEYSLAIAFIGFTFIFADFGLEALLIRDVAKNKSSNAHISDVFSTRFITSLIAFVLTVIAAQLLPYSEGVKLGITIVGMGNVVMMLSQMTWAVFRGEIRFDKMIIPQVLSSLFSLIAIYIGVSYNFELNYFFIVISSGFIVGFIASMMLYQEDFPAVIFEIKQVFKILKKTWPLGLGVIASVAYFKVDIILLSHFFDPSVWPDVGLYSLAYRPFEISILFAGFFTQTLYPVFAKLSREKTLLTSVKRYFVYSLVGAVSASVILYIFSPYIIDILGGNDFVGATAALRILALASGFTILAGFFNSAVIALNHEKIWLKVSIIALFMNILLNMLLIPEYSFIAASWVTVITQGIVALGSGLIFYSKIVLHHGEK